VWAGRELGWLVDADLGRDHGDRLAEPFDRLPRRAIGAYKVLTARKGDSLHAPRSVSRVSVTGYDLHGTAGYVVADSRGRMVGRVECPMYGTAPDVPDALSVRTGFLSRRRRLVPAEAIEDIDGTSGVIGLSVEREEIRRFL